MKRLILALLAVLWIVPAFSQDLTGTWVISQTEEEDKDGLRTNDHEVETYRRK